MTFVASEAGDIEKGWPTGGPTELPRFIVLLISSFYASASYTDNNVYKFVMVKC